MAHEVSAAAEPAPGQSVRVALLQEFLPPGGKLAEHRSEGLRYLLEFFGSLYDRKNHAAVVSELKGLQDMLGRFQDLIELPHRYIAAGCHPNRRTEALLKASPLEVERVEHGVQPRAFPSVRPTIIGSARPVPAT